MKKIITLFTLSFISTLTFAQLNNASFENWESPLLHNTVNVTGSLGGITVYVCDDFDYNELENWSSTNQLTNGSELGDIELVTQSTTAVDGTKSIQIETKELIINGYLIPGCFGPAQNAPNAPTIPGLIVNGTFNLDLQVLVDDILTGSGFNALNPFAYPGVGDAIDFIPKTISGHYQYTGGIDGSTVDSCMIVSGLKKNGELIGYVISVMPNAAAMTPFSFTYEHLNCETPDSIVTVISSSNLDLEITNGQFTLNSDELGIAGSILLMDALHLDTILPSEFPPLLNPDTTTIFTYEVADVEVQSNDLFCDNTPIVPVLYYSGTEGTAVVLANNHIEFTPTTGYDGTVNISYYNCNGASLCDTTILTIHVLPVLVCDAVDDSYSLSMNSTTTNNPKLNDIDCNTTITLITLPSNGVADLDFANNINYSPSSSFSGSDSLTYSICSPDLATQCDTATVRYTITPVGINELDARLIQFFPNPAKNTLNIVVDVDSEISVRIFNTLGKEMIVTNFNNNTIIDLNLSNGLYFVEIETAGKLSVKKLQIIK